LAKKIPPNSMVSSRTPPSVNRLSPKRVREHDEQPVALELEIGIEVEQIIACIGLTADQLTPGARR
jgi:hypothetical protein